MANGDVTPRHRHYQRQRLHHHLRLQTPLLLTSFGLLYLLSRSLSPAPAAALLPSSLSPPRPNRAGAPAISPASSRDRAAPYRPLPSYTHSEVSASVQAQNQKLPPLHARPATVTVPHASATEAEHSTCERRPFDRSEFESQNHRAMSARWGEFLRATAPLASDVAGLWASGRLRRDDASLARSVRTALVGLGPTFVKLGQILSVREDVLGPTWAAELAELQDSVRTFDGKEAWEAADRAFGAGAFESFEMEPFAAASIAQVHRAKWRLGPSNGGTGTSASTAVVVAVKVLRPGVADRVAVDLAVLLRAGDLLADWAPRLLPRSRVDWRALLRGLADGLWMECDLSGEAWRQEKFRSNMRSVPGVFVPEVYASTQDVMVSEWVDGVPLRVIPPKDPRLKHAQALMRDAYCQSMFVDAFFHADCHGGNLLWVPSADSHEGSPGDENNSSGELCILDCGLMVAIAPTASESLLRLSLNLASRDWANVVNDAISLGFLPINLSNSSVLQARGVARRILGPYLDVGGGARAASAYSASALFDDITAAASNLPISLPPDMVLLGRAVVQLEGLALRAYPDYRLVDDILPVAARIALRAAPPSQSQAADERMSFLSNLLFSDDTTGPLYRGTEIKAKRKSLALDRLKFLLATARNANFNMATGGMGAGKSSDSAVEDILDELLLSDAVRDLVAGETADVADALVRDALWRGVDSLAEAFPFPGLPNPLSLPVPIGRMESLAPRLSEEEKLVLLRLPEMFAESATTDQASRMGTDVAMPAGLLNNLMLTRIGEIPSLNRGIRTLTERALVQQDPKAREMVDSVAAKLRGLLQMRLVRTGVPADIAQRLVESAFLTPW